MRSFDAYNYRRALKRPEREREAQASKAAQSAS